MHRLITRDGGIGIGKYRYFLGIGIGIGWTKKHSIGIGIGIGKYRYFLGIGIGKNNTDPPSLLITNYKQIEHQCNQPQYVRRAG